MARKKRSSPPLNRVPSAEARAGDDGGAAPGQVPGERLWLVAILAAAAGLRLHQAWGTFLVPDEAIFAGIARAPDLAAVYRLTTEQAHPPLHFLLLHLWTKLAATDLFLRIPSMLAAVGTTALLFLWVRRRAGSLPGLAAAALFAASPSVVDLTSEVRQYSLLLLLVAGALFAASPPRGLPSGPRLAAVTALMAAASATHYSGILAAAAVFGALGFETYLRGAGRRTWAALTGAASAVGLLATALWWSHARALRGGALEAEAITGWLRPFYLQENDGLLRFLARSFRGVFHFLLGYPLLAALAALAAVVILLARARRDPATAALLAAPFVVAGVAAALRAYPLGATRHSVWMLPAAIAVLVLPLGSVGPAGRRWLPPVLAALIAAWASHAPRSTLSGIPRAARREAQMAGLLDAVSERVRPDDLVFVDQQTAVLLRRYLGGGPRADAPADEPFRTETLGHMRNVRASRTWIHTAPVFVRELVALREEGAVRPGEPVWVVHGGSGAQLPLELRAAYPRAPLFDVAGFGGFLWLFRVPVPGGLEAAPDTPPGAPPAREPSRP